MAESRELAIAFAKALKSKKGKKVVVLKTADLTTLTEYFVICTGTSNTHVRALSEECEKVADQLGEPIHHQEGHGNGEWVLMDYSSVVVHIFQEEAREFYDLERLWADAEPVELPEDEAQS